MLLFEADLDRARTPEAASHAFVVPGSPVAAYAARLPLCVTAAAARCSRSRCARGWPTCSTAWMARTEGTRSAARSAANTTAACSPSGSATGAPSRGRGTAADARAPRMTIIKSSYDPTSATAGHAAPMMPWPKPWATFAASVAIMPRPRSQRAGTARPPSEG